MTQNPFLQCQVLSLDSLSSVSEGFVGGPWRSILSTLCDTLPFIIHWLVLDHFICVL
jgi:hypothetical protein